MAPAKLILEDSAQLYSETIELSQEDKITAKNNSSMQVIDNTGLMVRGGPNGEVTTSFAKQETNFQVAGVALDALSAFTARVSTPSTPTPSRCCAVCSAPRRANVQRTEMKAMMMMATTRRNARSVGLAAARRWCPTFAASRCASKPRTSRSTPYFRRFTRPQQLQQCTPMLRELKARCGCIVGTSNLGRAQSSVARSVKLATANIDMCSNICTRSCLNMFCRMRDRYKPGAFIALPSREPTVERMLTPPGGEVGDCNKE